MCQAPSYTSPIAVSQPSTDSCCPITPMSTNSSSLGRYLKMDSASIDFVQAAPVVVRSQHLSYYVTIGVVLLAAWFFQSKQSSKTTKVKAPFYKASIVKWYFDAESLVRDSYLKVRGLRHLLYWHVWIYDLHDLQFYDQVYQIKATEGLQVLIPAKFIPELKGLPEEVLSATEALSEVSSPETRLAIIRGHVSC